MIPLDRIDAVIQPTVHKGYIVELRGWRGGEVVWSRYQFQSNIGLDVHWYAGSLEKAEKLAEKMIKKAQKRHDNITRKTIVVSPPREESQ